MKGINLSNWAIFFPLILMTILSFIVMINVLMGRIGHYEPWRILSSVAGFMLILGFSVFVAMIQCKKAHKNK